MMIKNNPSFPLNLYLAKIRPAGALTIIPKAIVAAQIIRVFISDFPKVRMVKILMYASRVKISGIKELIDKKGAYALFLSYYIDNKVQK